MKRYEVLALLRKYESFGDVAAVNKVLEYGDHLCRAMIGVSLESLLYGDRPTFRGDIDPRYDILADIYDCLVAGRGMGFKSYRG